MSPLRHHPLRVALILVLVQAACPQGPAGADDQAQRFARQRQQMVRRQIAGRGVKDERVLAALRKVERHRFVPAAAQDRAYADHPLDIGQGQTISQPYIVAAMSEALRLDPQDKVLEIGTGSGYQAAVLGELAREVYSMEIVPRLGQQAGRLLRELGYANVHVRVGDGYQGWPAQAPFDAIILTAAPAKIPEPLIAQLKVGGVLVAPVGPSQDQRLVRLTKTKSGIRQEQLMGVRFVPMTGKAQRSD